MPQALVHFPAVSLLLRFCLDALIRHSTFKNGKMIQPDKYLPTIDQLSHTISVRTAQQPSPVPFGHPHA